MENSTEIAIDVEGSFPGGGVIELIQCLVKDKIFIFDLWKVTGDVTDFDNKEDKKTQLYIHLFGFLKEIMENPNICKIFHDGREDALALHKFLDCCVINMFDTSAIYMLNENLSRFINLFSKRMLKNTNGVSKDSNGH